LPHLDDIQNDYDTAQVRIITISDDDWTTIKSYARGSPCLYLRDVSNSVWSLYRQGGYIPLNYVICPDQTVKDWMEGFSESQIRSWIDQCLPGVEEGTNRQLAIGNGQLSIHPNPFAQETVMEFRVRSLEFVDQKLLTLRIYDLAGRIVRSFHISKSTNLQINKLTWDGRDDGGTKVPSGLYFLKLTTGKASLTRKLVIAR
jgi:hypothetical protein